MFNYKHRLFYYLLSLACCYESDASCCRLSVLHSSVESALLVCRRISSLEGTSLLTTGLAAITESERQSSPWLIRRVSAIHIIFVVIGRQNVSRTTTEVVQRVRGRVKLDTWPNQYIVTNLDVGAVKHHHIHVDEGVVTNLDGFTKLTVKGRADNAASYLANRLACRLGC